MQSRRPQRHDTQLAALLALMLFVIGLAKMAANIVPVVRFTPLA